MTTINVTVGTSSTTALSANSSRIKARLINDGPYPVWLKYAIPPGGATITAAVLDEGIRLNQNGGVYETDSPGAYYAICKYSGAKLTGVDL